MSNFFGDRVFFRWASGCIQLLAEFCKFRLNSVQTVFEWRVAWEGRKPRVVTGQIAAVPLSADVVQLTDHTPTEQVNCVVVKHAVVTLVTGCTMQRLAIGVALAFGDTGHHLALGDVVGHEFFGQNMFALHHGFHRDRSMQMQRQGDDHGFDGIVVEQGFDAAIAAVVNFNAFPRFRFACILVLLNQSWASGRCCGRRPVAMESPVNAIRANVGNGGHLNILRGTTTDQHVSFVTGADDTDTNRVTNLLVAKIHRTKARAGDSSGCDDAVHELATREANCLIIIGLPGGAFFRSKLIHLRKSYR